jgi:hypothetical protein
MLCMAGEGVWLENSIVIREVGDRVGAGQSTQRGCGEFHCFSVHFK